MVGDRMDTDVISGLEAGLRTVLVLTGSTRAEQVERFPFRPTRVVDSVADLIPLVDELSPPAEAPVAPRAGDRGAQDRSSPAAAPGR
jgi:hypothetical protein